MSLLTGAHAVFLLLIQSLSVNMRWKHVLLSYAHAHCICCNIYMCTLCAMNQLRTYRFSCIVPRVPFPANMVFRSGDDVEVEIDCMHSKLTVRNITQNITDSTGLPSDKQWHLEVRICGKDDMVRILESTKLW